MTPYTICVETADIFSRFHKEMIAIYKQPDPRYPDTIAGETAIVNAILSEKYDVESVVFVEAQYHCGKRLTPNVYEITFADVSHFTFFVMTCDINYQPVGI